MEKQRRKGFYLDKEKKTVRSKKQAMGMEGHNPVGKKERKKSKESRAKELTSRLGTALGADDRHPVADKD